MKRARLWQMSEMANVAAHFGAACREASIMVARARHASSEAMREFYRRDARQCAKVAREYWAQLQALEAQARS